MKYTVAIILILLFAFIAWRIFRKKDAPTVGTPNADTSQEAKDQALKDYVKAMGGKE